MQVELTDEEAALVREMAQETLKTVRVEIHHARHREFKEVLKEKEGLLDGLLLKIPELAR